MKNVILKSTLLTTLIVTAAAAAAPAWAEVRADVAQLYVSAAHGDKAATPAAYAALNEALAADPSDALTLAYAGSASTLMGRDAKTPELASRYTTAGLKQLAAAVAAIGEEQQARDHNGLTEAAYIEALAATTMTAVPDFFGYQVRGLELFTTLLADDAFNSRPLANRSWVYPYAVQVAVKHKEMALAEQWAKVVTDGMPESAAAKRIAEILGN